MRILWKPEEMVAKEDVSIKCEVEGSHPRAKVTWFESFSVFTRGRVSIINAPFDIRALVCDSLDDDEATP